MFQIAVIIIRLTSPCTEGATSIRKGGGTGALAASGGCSPQLTLLSCQKRLLSAENSGKRLAVGAPPRAPLGDLTALPRPPSRWGGVAAPSRGTTPPLSAFSPSVLAQWKMLDAPLEGAVFPSLPPRQLSRDRNVTSMRIKRACDWSCCECVSILGVCYMLLLCSLY